MATIITVHGTGATGPEIGEGWWQRHSVFEGMLRALVEARKGALHCEPFVWDGANSETSRRVAARRLLKRCRELQRRGEDYCIVGHSHGGSVIASALFQAARERRELSRLRRWITVGTPFPVCAKRSLLFNRLNFWEKSGYVLVLTLMLLTTVAIFAVPEFRQLSTTFRADRVHIYLLGALILYSPAFLLFLLLNYLNSRRCLSGSRKAARRFQQHYGVTWLSLYHENDEAIRGLGLAQSVSFRIFRPLFLLPQLSLLVLILLPIALVALVLSESAITRLFALFENADILPAAYVENGRLRGNGRDIAVNALLVTSIPSFLMDRIGLGPLQKAVFDLASSSVYLAPLGLLFYAALFYVLSLIAVMAIIAMGGLASLGLSRVLDVATWRQLRALAFGDDHQAEAITGSALHPMWATSSMPSLPVALSEEISALSDEKAARSIARLRAALNVLAFAEGGHQRSDMLTEYLCWDELIHTCYFQVPRFQKLLAYAISAAEGFRQTEEFKADPDFPMVASWLQELEGHAQAAGSGGGA